VSALPPAGRGFAAWLWRRPRRWFLLGIPIGGVLAFLVGIAFTGSFIGGLKLAETDAFCTSCHEMGTPYQEYTRSVHFSNAIGIRASCGNCHVPPAFIPGLIRHIQAYAEVWGHMRGELNTPVKYEAHRAELAQTIWKELKSNDSAECRSCHTVAAMALASQNAFAAARHAPGYMTANHLTCIDCHKGVAHSLPGAS
jgi:nitrate/TMAO reductase-like tetraheme cytochrome c subunit